jgi:putative transposase
MRPARESVKSGGQTYFVSSQTVARQPFFRHERWALLMEEVLQHYRNSYLLHAYVVMPDHFHIIITSRESIERAMQNIKGGFSFRAKRAFDWKFDIWQVGFSDHRIRDIEDWNHHISYMRYNPVKAKLAVDYRYLAFDLDPIPQRLKPSFLAGSDGGPEAPPLQNQASPGAEAPPLQKQASPEAEAPPLQKQGLVETEVPTLQKPGLAKPMGRAEVLFTSHIGPLERNK